MILAQAAAELAAGRHGVYLVTATFGGIVLRAATRSSDVPWSVGYDLQYQAIVKIEPFESSIDSVSLTGIGSYESARIEFADEAIDAVSLQLAGHPIAGAVVEIALWWPGQDWTQREVVLRGRVKSPTLTTAGRLTGFTAMASSSSSSVGVVDPDRSVYPGEYTTFIAEAHNGERMPVILGAARNVPGIKVSPAFGTGDRLVIAGHWLGAVTALNAYEDGSETAIVGAPWAVTNGFSDVSGEKVAYLEDVSVSFWSSRGAITVDCRYGGAPRKDGPGATRTASDVLVWLLLRSGLRVDWRRMQRALTMLSTWEVGVYTDAEEAAQAVADQWLLPLLPLVRLEGGDGLWYHYADLQLSHPEAELVEGQNLLGMVEGTGLDWSDDDDCRTSFTMKWSYDHHKRETRKATTFDHTNDPLCHLAREALQEIRVAPAVSAEVLWTDTATRRSLVHQSRRQTRPAGTCRAVVEPETLAGLREGATVLLTWSPWGLVRRPVLVRNRYPACDVAEIVLTVVPATTLRDGRL